MTDWLEQILSRAAGTEAEIRPRPLARFENSAGEELVVNEPAQAELQSSPAAQPAEAKSQRQTGFASVNQPSAFPPPLRLADEAAPLPERHDSPARQTQQAIEPRRADAKLPASSREEKLIHTTKVIERLWLEDSDEKSSPTGVAQPATEKPEPGFLQPMPIAPPEPPFERKEIVLMPSTAPTVRVNIGRIEISVAAPPAVAPRPAPRAVPASAKPARSLDDYLRRRNGGER